MVNIVRIPKGQDQSQHSRGSPPASGQTKGHSKLVWYEPKTGSDNRKGPGYADVHTGREGKGGEERGGAKGGKGRGREGRDKRRGREAVGKMHDNAANNHLSQF